MTLSAIPGQSLRRNPALYFLVCAHQTTGIPGYPLSVYTDLCNARESASQHNLIFWTDNINEKNKQKRIC